MKKQLIAAAVAAALAAPAMAQVTIYGVMDTGYATNDEKTTDGPTAAKTKLTGSGVDNTTGDADTKGGLSSSRLGFRGTEDLGGGMKANFVWEAELNVGSGFFETAANSGTRMSWVGLTTPSFGEVRIGRDYTSIHTAVTANSAIGGTNLAGDVLYSPGARSVGAVTTSMRMHSYDGSETSTTTADATYLMGDAVRMRDGGIHYKSPTFNGVQLTVDYNPQKTAQTQSSTAGTDHDEMGWGVTYKAGKLSAMYASHKIEQRDNGVASKDTGESTALTGKYDFGMFELHAAYATKNLDDDNVRELRQTVNQLGVTIPMGNLKLAAQYGAGDAEGASRAEKVDLKGHQILAQYNMSKRTSVYALIGQDEFKVKRSATANHIGDKVQREQSFIGVRHSF